jgi:hypothetical protein
MCCSVNEWRDHAPKPCPGSWAVEFVVPVDYVSGDVALEQGLCFRTVALCVQHLFSQSCGYAQHTYVPDELEWGFMAWRSHTHCTRISAMKSFKQ